MVIVHFLLLLAPLIFFHELGHFVLARLMGVRVLSFSLGFGPVVFAWERGGTEYAIRALPLGGFVRMHGGDPSEAAYSEAARDPDAFSSKPVWRRTLIIAAGPVANFILPIFILFFGSLIGDGEVISSRIGSVVTGGPAAIAGLRTGDRIVEIEGVPVAHFADVQREISRRPAMATHIVYKRLGERSEVTLTPLAWRDVRLPELGINPTVGRIQVRSQAQSAIVSVRPGSIAWKAGLRTGWLIREVDGVQVPRYYELEQALKAKGRRGGVLNLGVAPLVLNKPLSREVLRQGEVTTYVEATETLPLPIPAGALAEELGIAPAETVIGFVQRGTPADLQAGLRPGDEILEVDGVRVHSFFGLLEKLRASFDDARVDPDHRGLSGQELLVILKEAVKRPHTLTVQRPDLKALAGSVRVQVQITPKVTLDTHDHPSLSFGFGPLQRFEAAERVHNDKRLVYAWDHTWNEMGRAVKVTLLTVAGLFKGDVPVKEVGGPIFMAQLAARTADLGWGYFFHLMVWISINLAILNLLPIPLVDGGHLLFLLIEGIRREPVSLRIRMVVSYVGMAFIGLLFVVVMKNDVQRALSAWIN